MIKTENNNSLSMGASAHRYPEEQHVTYSKMPEGIGPKILRTPRWKLPNPYEPYLFFGEFGHTYKYVVYNTFNGPPEFKELCFNENTHSLYVSDPIDMSKINNEALKELKRFLISERTKNNGNSSFCTRIFDSLSDIRINS